MVKLVLFLFLAVIVITVIRSVIGILAKAFRTMLEPSPGPVPVPPPATAGGELKRDPVCGTYVPVPAALTKTVRGTVFYFCSQDCLDKHKA